MRERERGWREGQIGVIYLDNTVISQLSADHKTISKVPGVVTDWQAEAVADTDVDITFVFPSSSHQTDFALSCAFFYLCESPGVTDHSSPLPTTVVIIGVVGAVGKSSLCSGTVNICHSEVITDPTILIHLRKILIIRERCCDIPGVVLN